MSALNRLLDYQQDFTAEAPPLVEISRQKSRDGSFEWYGLLNHTGQLGNAFYEPVPILNIKLSFRPQKTVRSVKSLTANRPIPFYISENGRIEITHPNLASYDVILVEY